MELNPVVSDIDHATLQNLDFANAGHTGELPIANGGTGEDTAQEAIDALTAVAGATNEHVLTKDTGSGNAIFKASAYEGMGRKFSAYQATADAQSIDTETYTKLNFPTEAWDVDGEFASSRFTPTTAGYYRASMGVTLLSVNDGTYVEAGIHKNVRFAAPIARNALSSGAGQSVAINATRIFYLNGSTDYLECYLFHNHGASRSTQGNDTYRSTFFDAERVG